MEEDALILALFLGAGIAFWFLQSRNRKRELENAEPVVAPSRPAAHAGREYWEKYDSKDEWTSSVATERKKNFAGGKQGRPLDVILPKREYVPKKPAWAGSGTAHGDRQAEREQAQGKIEEGSVSDTAESNDQRSSEASDGEDEKDNSAFQDAAAAAAAAGSARRQQGDDVGWTPVLPIKAEDTESGRRYHAQVQQKFEDGWRLDEDMVVRLLQEGFGVRAAARACLVGQDFDGCLLFLFRRLEDGWVNAPWGDEEVSLLGSDWVKRLEELEKEVLANANRVRSAERAGAERAQQAAPSSPASLSEPAQGLPVQDSAPSSSSGAALADSIAQSAAAAAVEGDAPATLRPGVAGRRPEALAASGDAARAAAQAALPAAVVTSVSPAEVPARAAGRPARSEWEAAARGGAAAAGERGRAVLPSREGERKSMEVEVEVEALLEEAGRVAAGGGGAGAEELGAAVFARACRAAWAPLESLRSAARGGGRGEETGLGDGPLELRGGAAFCAEVWRRSESEAAGEAAGEGQRRETGRGAAAVEALRGVLLQAALQAVTRGCPRPDNVVPPASSTSFRAPGHLEEADAILRHPPFAAALLDLLQRQGAPPHSVDGVFAPVLTEIFEAVAASGTSLSALGGWRRAEAACRALAGFGEHAALTALLAKSFASPPPPGIPAALRLFQCAPISVHPPMTLDDPAAGECGRGWLRVTAALKGALPLRDPGFREAFLGWAARALTKPDMGRFTHAAGSGELPSLALLLGLLARPFLAVDSPIHRKWTRLDPAWYSVSGRVEVGGSRKLRWWSGQREEEAAGSKGEEGFALSAEEAGELAKAVAASSAGREGEEGEAGLLEESGEWGGTWWRSALKHCQGERGKAKEAGERARWEGKAAAMKVMLGGLGGGGAVAGWGGWGMNYGEAGEMFLGLAAMAMAWVESMRGSARAMEHVPEYVLHDSLHVVWTCWMETPAQFLASRYSAVALDAFPALISRRGGLSSTFLRYRFADVIAQARERDRQEGRTRWDSRLCQLEASPTCTSHLAAALAELYADLEGVTPAEAHAFDKNGARGRVAGLLLELLASDTFLEPLARLSPVPPPGAKSHARGGGRGGGGVAVLEGFLHAVVGDGAFVLEDALNRLADIRAMQADMQGEAWAKLPEGVKRDRTNLHGQLEGVAVHFLQLAKNDLALLDLLVAHPSIRAVLCDGELGVRFGGFVDMAVAHLCGHKSRQLHLQDPARYGFDPKELVKHLCGLIGRASDSPQVTASLRVAAAATVYGRLLRIASTKLGLDPDTAHRVKALLQPLLQNAQSGAVEEAGAEDEGSRSLAGGGEAEGESEARKPFAASPEEVEAYKEALQGLAFAQVEMRSSSGEVGHHYWRDIRESAAGGSGNTRRVRRLIQELHALAEDKCLPVSPDASIFVRVDEARMDVIKVLLSGPTETPYALGLWEFHVFFPESYPAAPPLVHLETTGNGLVRFNPNLYSDGKVCLSLLGTWHGEGWSPQTSTLLQVLVSIQSLIMVKEPYFNEPGYELQRGSAEGRRRSQQYNDDVHLNAIRHAMLSHLRRPPAGFADAVRAHFAAVSEPLQRECARWVEEATDEAVKGELRAAIADLRTALGTAAAES